MMKESQNKSFKFKWPAILRAPFSSRGKRNGAGVENSSLRDDTYEPSDSDASSTRGPSTSTDGNINQRTSVSVAVLNDLSVDGRCLSPAPSQATRSHRHSMSKATSGEHVRVSLTVDTIKQQLNDGLQVLAEFKKSLRASSDVQRYNEAVGSFEGAAKDLATLKTKLSSSGSRKLGAGGSGGANNNRNSWVLPPPDLKVEIEDTPFSLGIPGMEEPHQKEMLEVVQENKENEAQEEGIQF